MQLRFTLVADPERPVGLTLRCEAGTRGSEIVEALAEAGHIETGQSLYCDESDLDDLRVGHAPLVHGCTLVSQRLGRPSPAGPPVEVAVVAGPDAGRVHPLAWGTTTIGRGAVDVRIDDPHLSRHHATLTLSGDGVSLDVGAAVNPVEVNGDPVIDSCDLAPDALIRLGTTVVALRSGPRWEPAVHRGDGHGHLAVHRSPMDTALPRPRVVDVPAAATLGRGVSVPWAMLLIPLPISALMAWFLGPAMLLFGLFGPAMALGNMAVDVVQRRREERRNRATHGRALDDARREMSALLDAERRVVELLHPDPSALIEIAENRLTPLWSRSADSPVFLQLRVGVGTVPSRHAVTSGGERRHPDLRLTPVTIDLPATGVLGVAGPPEAVRAHLRYLLGQVGVLHSPNDVLVTPADATARGGATERRWSDWLPHRLAAEVDPLQELERRAAGGAQSPRLLVVADDCAQLRERPEWKDLLARGPSHGICIIAAAEALEALPHECRAVVEVADATAGRLRRDGDDDPRDLVIDGVGGWWAERVGRALAPLRDATPGAARALPRSLSLVDLWADHGNSCTGPESITKWWAHDGTTLPVGIGERGPVLLDLARLGPHALVAGTTGSGKSELLQSWVLALAAAEPPSRLQVFLADFKGGATFAELAGLPHCVGLVTDLDAGAAQRALAALQAEVRRREEMLAAAGARSFGDLRGLPADRLARLVVLVDEYRVLAEELPEVLEGLVRLATVGRSLGIHLVLATQRPAGIVSADIAANASLRIALRTQDVGDSRHAIDAPDAAHIPAALPGRAVMCADSGEVVPFQTARVSAAAAGQEAAPVVWRVCEREPERPAGEVTDVTRLVATITQAALTSGEPAAPPVWHPPLPMSVGTDELPSAASGGVAWGLVDEPQERRWAPLEWRPEGGHIAVIGSDVAARDGAITALIGQVLAAHSPSRVHLHLASVMTLPAWIRDAGHVGSVVDPADIWTTKRLLTRLAALVRARRDRGCAEADPTLVVIVDADAVAGTAADPAGASLTDLLIDVLRSGASVGVRAVLSGSRSLLLGRLSSFAPERYVLPMADASDLVLAGVPRSALDGAPFGRAVRVGDGALVQFARSVEPSVPPTTTRPPEPPIGVVPLPPEVSWGALTPPGRHGAPGWVIGVGGDSAEPITLDPADLGRRWLISGPSSSGRSTTLITLGRSARAAGSAVALVTPHPPDHEHDLTGFLPGDGERLRAWLSDNPGGLVLVDDADRLTGTDVEEVLVAHDERLDHTGGVIALAVSTSALATSFRGLPPRIARAQAGVLLCPGSPIDGEPFGVRVDPMERRSGRGYVIARGAAIGMQVAHTAPARARRAAVSGW